MGWDRRLPAVPNPPAPISLGAWLGAGVLSVIAGVGLLLLRDSGRLSALEPVAPAVLTAAPIVLWLLMLATRAWQYGNALNEVEFQRQQALEAAHSWESWGSRHLIVYASCVLLPGAVCAQTLVGGGLPPNPEPARARRIDGLPLSAQDRANAGFRRLLAALQPTLQTLTAGQIHNVTLLTDADASLHEALCTLWSDQCPADVDHPPVILSVVRELPCAWVDTCIRSASGLELVFILQVQGADLYADGMAAFLLSPDGVGSTTGLTPRATLLRPMPLNPDALEAEVAVFLHTQTGARAFNGIVADVAAWHPRLVSLLSIAAQHGSAPNLAHQWIVQSLCGPPGPFAHWLTLALAVDLAQCLDDSLLILTREGEHCCINTLSTGVPV